ncbi:MAG TPA: hypothetical protein VEG68_16795 [Terriglobales bacterium]|nr:hypothetical protein [Terriglobales bacterium]
MVALGERDGALRPNVLFLDVVGGNKYLQFLNHEILVRQNLPDHETCVDDVHGCFFGNRGRLLRKRVVVLFDHAGQEIRRVDLQTPLLRFHLVLHSFVGQLPHALSKVRLEDFPGLFSSRFRTVDQRLFNQAGHRLGRRLIF